jgi:hypothetical protein
MRIRVAPAAELGEALELRASLDNLTGAGLCTTGTYTLQMLLRISTGDETCTGASCTFIDFPFGVAFNPPSHADTDIDQVKIEDKLHVLAPGLDLDDANYEILSARIVDPFGVPMAAAGLGNHGAKDFYSNLGTTYPECQVPNETSNTGTVPVCAPIAWTPLCDANAGSVKWHTPSAGQFELEPELFRLQGSAADCATGAYQFDSTLRITTNDCGGAAVPCTLVDTVVPLSVTPTKADVDDLTIPITASGLTGPLDNIEILHVRVHEPSGALLFSTALTNAWRLVKPSVQIGRKKLDVATDDEIKVQGHMLRVPHIDPNVGAGVTIAVRDHTGPMYTVTIPAGAWEVRGFGSWRYQDKSAALNGVRTATIKLGPSPDGGGYAVKLKAKGLDLSAATYPAVDLVITAPNEGGTATVTAKSNRTCKVGTKTLKCK